MTTSTKPRTIGGKISHFVIIYFLPVFCVGYVNYNKCWPYNAIKKFYKDTAGQQAQWVNDDIVYSTTFIIFAGIYYRICYIIKKIF